MVHFANPHSFVDEDSIFPAGKAIIIDNGRIEKIEDSSLIEEEYSLQSSTPKNDHEYKTIDLGGRAIVPGLIDPHTHLLWSGDRSTEVRLRREGMTYAQIAQQGGGIQTTVRSTRQSSDDTLYESGYTRLREALRTGTTHLEAKSGYGLNTHHELRLLEVGNKLSRLKGVPTIDLTWMGAHDFPHDVGRKAYVEQLVSEQLPSVVEQGFANNADVFCEPGWFSLEESEDILQASRKGGLNLRMHIDEFSDGGGGELAASLNVVTADHAYHTPMSARQMMKDAGVMTGFLPGTPYSMGQQWPRMEEIANANIAYTLATDFNPNCLTLSLPFMASLMVQRCNVHPLEALRAITVNAAKTTPHPSGKIHGQLVKGAVANINIVNGPSWELAVLKPTDTPFQSTILNGQYILH